MVYRKIKITYDINGENRFFRTFLVQEDMDLKAFGCAILTSLYATFENDYYFTCGFTRYLPNYLIRKFHEKEDKLIDDYKVNNLENEFVFNYGFDEYTFLGQKLEIVVNDLTEEICLIDGAGLGIYENNFHTLNSYLLGNLNPNSLDVDYCDDIYPPTNVKITKYGDFDTNFNLEQLQACFYALWKLRLRSLTKNEKVETNNEITMIIHHQINTNLQIKLIYENLLKKYPQMDVVLMMYKKYIQEMITAISLEESFNEERYLNRLEELD